ncbi:hypothetical protein EYF80_011560 [Liparis tanakae]|uniref:Uncharacterized protein n=1 Tax=Liparis tanakae TaxID=230148 RepID=A0A4Z2IJZ2_9TELE|nr:hypothetical protein EYF80_011560 [Liparis tanakae]
MERLEAVAQLQPARLHPHLLTYSTLKRLTPIGNLYALSSSCHCGFKFSGVMDMSKMEQGICRLPPNALGLIIALHNPTSPCK